MRGPNRREPRIVHKGSLLVEEIHEGSTPVSKLVNLVKDIFHFFLNHDILNISFIGGEEIVRTLNLYLLNFITRLLNIRLLNLSYVAILILLLNLLTGIRFGLEDFYHITNAHILR